MTKKMSMRNEEILRMRLEERRPLEEIGEHFGISRQRVCQIIGYSTGWISHKLKERRMTLHELAWALVEKGKSPDECWEVPSRKHHLFGAKRLNYSVSNRNPKWFYIHRLVYEYINGEIDDGMCVIHKCRNFGCSNPNHLVLDKVGRGRKYAKEKI